MKIGILGATGSIGRQTLDVAARLPGAEVVALAAYENINLLEEQILAFRPAVAAVLREDKALELRNRVKPYNVKVLSGEEGLLEAAAYGPADMVVSAIVGQAGLAPTLAAIEAGKDIALANKETLVTAGALVTRAARRKGVRLLPVDSEHSAVYQCLWGNQGNAVRTLYLTASGGPFRGLTRETLAGVTREDALRHPNWSMGPKITVDSATLMNKGLEVIEAKWLFDVNPAQIQVLVHPQSVIHSMVEFEDGAVLAQLGQPDMRVPIQYALTGPARVASDYPRLDFMKQNTLTFEAPDTDTFPCLRYAFEALARGGLVPAVMNGANEAAVALFLAGKIAFTAIPRLIEGAMEAYTDNAHADDYSLPDVRQADTFGRAYVEAHK